MTIRVIIGKGEALNIDDLCDRLEGHPGIHPRASREEMRHLVEKVRADLIAEIERLRASLAYADALVEQAVAEGKP